MSHAPNYRLVIMLDAVDPKAVTLAFLELWANSPKEAWATAETFIHPNAKVLSITATRESPR